MSKKNEFTVAQWENFFTETTFQFLCNGQKDMRAKNYLSAIVWSAVFTESLLKDILTMKGVACGTLAIKNLIDQIESKVNNTDVFCDADKKQLKEITQVSDSIRLFRNELFHDNRQAKEFIEQQAKSIYDLYLEKMIRAYVETTIAIAIKQTNTHSAQMDGGSDGQLDFPVFVSTITPYTFEQAVFIESFCKRLEEIGAKPVRCKPEDFGTKKPMEVVCKMISKCNAVVVLGLEKYHVYHHMEKKGSSKPREEINRSFSSEWLQLESGMAFGLGKKVFVIHQQGLHRQGIFDHEWNSVTPLELDGPLDAKCSEVDSLLRDIKEYMEEYQK